MVMRVGLVLLAGWIITLKNDVVTWFGMGFSVKDFILIVGGGFLVYKAVMEIHHKLEGEEEHEEASSTSGAVAGITFRSVLLQILALDLVFSLDSVITAVGMTDHLLVIIGAVVVSFGVMLFAARYVFAFVNAHPTVKMLALSFLLLIGVFLVAEGFGYHIDKAFIYGPMAFAILVESLNLVAAKRKARRDAARTFRPVQLRPARPRVGETAALNAALSTGPAASVALSRRPVFPADAGTSGPVPPAATPPGATEDD